MCGTLISDDEGRGQALARRRRGKGSWPARSDSEPRGYSRDSLAKVDIGVPDVDAFARYSYSDNVPFLARNFGSFGVHFGYDLFDAGRKRPVLREREAQLSVAKENLARVSDDVELAAQTAYNKLERTEQMLKVSQELLATGTESSRVVQEELTHGATLSS